MVMRLFVVIMVRCCDRVVICVDMLIFKQSCTSLRILELLTAVSPIPTCPTYQHTDWQAHHLLSGFAVEFQLESNTG